MQEITNEQSELIEDFINRYYNIEADISTVVRQVEYLSDAVRELDTNINDLSEDYTDSMRQEVNEHFGTDNLKTLRQELLGYALGWIKV